MHPFKVQEDLPAFPPFGQFKGPVIGPHGIKFLRDQGWLQGNEAWQLSQFLFVGTAEFVAWQYGIEHPLRGSGAKWPGLFSRPSCWTFQKSLWLPAMSVPVPPQL